MGQRQGRGDGALGSVASCFGHIYDIDNIGGFGGSCKAEEKNRKARAAYERKKEQEQQESEAVLGEGRFFSFCFGSGFYLRPARARRAAAAVNQILARTIHVRVIRISLISLVSLVILAVPAVRVIIHVALLSCKF
jgi:hypothetical protein